MPDKPAPPPKESGKQKMERIIREEVDDPRAKAEREGKN